MIDTQKEVVRKAVFDVAVTAAVNGIDLEKTIGDITELMKPMMELAEKNMAYILKCLQKGVDDK